MGTGKTTVGAELSIRLNKILFDMDTEISSIAGMSISEIFDLYGEEKFRDMETTECLMLGKFNNVIISTGGGVVLRKENIEYLRENGIIVCLNASPETIKKRVETDRARPLLESKNLLNKITELLKYRNPFYENADIQIDTEDKTPSDIAWEIIEKMEQLDG